MKKFFNRQIWLGGRFVEENLMFDTGGAYALRLYSQCGRCGCCE